MVGPDMNWSSENNKTILRKPTDRFQKKNNSDEFFQWKSMND